MSELKATPGADPALVASQSSQSPLSRPSGFDPGDVERVANLLLDAFKRGPGPKHRSPSREDFRRMARAVCARTAGVKIGWCDPPMPNPDYFYYGGEMR